MSFVRSTTVTTTEEIEGDYRRVKRVRVDTLRFMLGTNAQEPRPLWPDDAPIQTIGEIREIDGQRWICTSLYPSEDRGLPRSYTIDITLTALGTVPAPEDFTGGATAYVEAVEPDRDYRFAQYRDNREETGTRLILWLPGSFPTRLDFRTPMLVKEVAR